MNNLFLVEAQEDSFSENQIAIIMTLQSRDLIIEMLRSNQTLPIAAPRRSGQKERDVKRNYIPHSV